MSGKVHFQVEVILFNKDFNQTVLNRWFSKVILL